MTILSSSINAALLGGALIGLSSGLMLVFEGRIAGLSGIISHALVQPFEASRWRWSFLFGLIIGGLILLAVAPERIGLPPATDSFAWVAGAGLLVGFGTRLGGGCTSGHGVCGVSRLSRRSIVATFCFLIAGIATATFIGHGVTQ